MTKIKMLIIILLLSIFTGSLFSNASADTLGGLAKNRKYLYSGYIFAVSDLTGDGKGEMIARIRGEENPSILRWNGIRFRKLQELETPVQINDVAIGDVDNDGEIEIVAISKEKIYVFEKDNKRFKLNQSKTTDIYGDKRFGTEEKLGVVEEYIKEMAEEPRRRIERLDEGKLGGRRIVIGDIDNDGQNELMITRTLPWIVDDAIRYIVETLKWNGKHLEVIHCWPGKLGSGESGVATDDVNNDGKNEIIYGSNNDYIQFLTYNKPKGFYDGVLGLFVSNGQYWVRGLRMNIGRIGEETVLVYCYNTYFWGADTPMDYEGIDENVIKYFTIKDDTFPQFKKTLEEISYENNFVRLKNFPKYGLELKSMDEEIKAMEKFVFGNLDRDKENELIVNAAAGAYIYGLKFNVALIVTIIIGTVLILALAVFLLIRRRKKKQLEKV